MHTLNNRECHQNETLFSQKINKINRSAGSQNKRRDNVHIRKNKRKLLLSTLK